MPFDIEGARKAGYTDAEIADYAGKEGVFDTEGARKSGYTNAEIVAFVSQSPKKESREPNILDKIGQRATNVENIFTKNVPSGETVYESVRNAPGRILQVAGQTAGVWGDVAVEGLKEGYKAVVPESVQQAIKSGAESIIQSPTVQKGIGVISGAYGKAEEKFPEGMRNVEAVANIAGAVPIVRGVTAAGKGVAVAGKVLTTMTLKEAETMVAKGVSAANNYIRAEVERGFKKGVKPTIVGKSDAELTKKFYDNATIATKDIVTAAPETIPKTVDEFSQSVRSVKKTLIDNSKAMAKEAGQEGATVSIQDLRNEMQAIINAPNIRAAEKNSAQYILNEIKDYKDLVDPTTAENLIASFNSDTKGFWKRPDWNKAGDALMTERSANILRRLTDESISNYQGPGWQELRNRYGAQTAIEKAVTDRANVHARANVKGFFDLTNVFTTGEFVAGVASMNPVMLARSAAMYSAKQYIKSQNNVDNIVKTMFKNVKNRMEKLPGGIGELSTVKDTISKTGEMLPPTRPPWSGDKPGTPWENIGPWTQVEPESIPVGVPRRPPGGESPSGNWLRPGDWVKGELESIPVNVPVRSPYRGSPITRDYLEPKKWKK